MLRMLTAVCGQPGDDRDLSIAADGLRVGDAAAPSDPQWGSDVTRFGPGKELPQEVHP